MRSILIVVAGLAASGPALAQQVGNFLVDVERDRMGRVGHLIALTVQGEGALAIRCIDGRQSLSFSVLPAYVPRGQSVDVSLSLDGAAPIRLPGKVLASTSTETSFQVGTASDVARLASAGQVSMTYQLNGASASYLFRLIEADQVVKAVQSACPARPAS